MSTFIKNQSTWKLAQLKKLTFKELKTEFEKLVKSIEHFVPMGSKERVKRQGAPLEQETSMKQKIVFEDVSVTEGKGDEPIKKIGNKNEGFMKTMIRWSCEFPTKKKQIARKGIHTDKTTKDEAEEDMKASVKGDHPSELYRLAMQRYGTNGPEDEYERVFWGDLKTIMHCLNLESADIYMLTERRYPLSADVCQATLDKKLQGGKQDEVCYQLLKMIKKQAGIR
ncbi:hypothetical protein Tco_0966548 [Tanacetum coccineum]